MNKELKEQAHKEFEEKKLVTGAMWLVKMWEKNKNNTEIEIELPEHIKDEFRYFIDSLVDKTVQMTEERIVGVIEVIHTKHYIPNHFNPIENKEHLGYRKAQMDIIKSIITNKNNINKQ